VGGGAPARRAPLARRAPPRPLPRGGTARGPHAGQVPARPPPGARGRGGPRALHRRRGGVAPAGAGRALRPPARARPPRGGGGRRGNRARPLPAA
jgi:hypothetical protein